MPEKTPMPTTQDPINEELQKWIGTLGWLLGAAISAIWTAVIVVNNTERAPAWVLLLLFIVCTFVLREFIGWIWQGILYREEEEGGDGNDND